MSSTDRSQTSRASGSDISSANFTKPGNSLGRKGAASRASSTSFDMLQMIKAAWRLSAVAPAPRSPSARDRSGTTTASVGASTDWTKVVAANEWTHSGTSLGRTAAEMSLGSTGSTSRLPQRPKHAVIAALAAAATSFFVSQRQGVTSGTTPGRQAATCFGANEQSAVRRSSAATRAGHCCSTAMALKRQGSSRGAASAGSTGTQAASAALAAALTGPFFEPHASRTAA